MAARRNARLLPQLLHGFPLSSPASQSSTRHTAGLPSRYIDCQFGESSKSQLHKSIAEAKHKPGLWMLQNNRFADPLCKVRLGEGLNPAFARSLSTATSQVEAQGTEKEAVSDETVRASEEEIVGGVPDSSGSTSKKEAAHENEANTVKEAVQDKSEEDNEALLSLLAERNALLGEKGKQLAELKERELTSLAELKNVMERLQRESDNVKKYAIQDFAKSLLDVADNLGRAFATIPENVCKEIVNDSSETAKFLKNLLEGVVMTEKELMKVLKNFGIEKFEPVGQPFDPNAHLALFEMADPSKEAGMVAMVVKAGYMLHDRVLRPAEVGVVKSLE